MGNSNLIATFVLIICGQNECHIKRLKHIFSIVDFAQHLFSKKMLKTSFCVNGEAQTVACSCLIYTDPDGAICLHARSH